MLRPSLGHNDSMTHTKNEWAGGTENDKCRQAQLADALLQHIAAYGRRLLNKAKYCRGIIWINVQKISRKWARGTGQCNIGYATVLMQVFRCVGRISLISNRFFSPLNILFIRAAVLLRQPKRVFFYCSFLFIPPRTSGLCITEH